MQLFRHSPSVLLYNELYISNILIGEFMGSVAATGRSGIVISALRARANFGRILQRLENERGSLVIEKRGRPRAVLLSIREYVKLAAPEPEVLRAIGEQSRRNATSNLTSRQIDRIIEASRRKSKRK